MITVNANLYLISIFITMIILLLIFNFLYTDNKFSLKERLLLFAIIFFLFFISEIILNGIIEILFPIILYFIFKRKKVDDYLISTIFISFIVYNVSLTLSTMIINKTINLFPNQTLIIVILIALQLLFSASIVLALLKFKIREKLKNKSNIFINLLLGYSYLLMFFLIISAQYFEAYMPLIDGLIIFLLIQSSLVIISFYLEKNRQKRYYNDKLNKEQIKNLKKYTDQLEHDQLDLRRFKHDYKNLLHSLEIDVKNKDYNNLQEYLKNLNEYSDKHLNNISTEIYRDLANIKIPYLKSLFISKLNQIIQKKIDCSFECAYVLNNIPINEFDLIRLLGITIDNAIEATEGCKEGKITISIVNLEKIIIFNIENTSDLSKLTFNDLSVTGYTTKKNHSGIGLSNINEIKKKYSNMLIDHSTKNKIFSIQIKLMKGAEYDNKSINM